jgi:hypothetical protein
MGSVRYYITSNFAINTIVRMVKLRRFLRQQILAEFRWGNLIENEHLEEG